MPYSIEIQIELHVGCSDLSRMGIGKLETTNWLYTTFAMITFSYQYKKNIGTMGLCEKCWPEKLLDFYLL